MISLINKSVLYRFNKGIYCFEAILIFEGNLFETFSLISSDFNLMLGLS